MSQELKALIDSYRTITIVSHIDPDADALGTSLGIYSLLKNYGKQVEIVNYSSTLPQHLDFLPNFSKIKSKMSYDKSLIIACDCGSLDRLGFDFSARDIINIDHHETNTLYGKINIINASLASASYVAYIEMKKYFPITADVATCFYTALVSDTQYFSTNNVDKDLFTFAMELITSGANPKEVSFNLNSRKSLASVRILSKALSTLQLHQNATIASVKIDNNMILSTGAIMSDMVGIVDILRSLATVEVAIALIVQNDLIKVSLRSKHKNLSTIAQYFGGGGHPNACGFTYATTNTQELLDKILQKLNA